MCVCIVSLMLPVYSFYRNFWWIKMYILWNTGFWNVNLGVTTCPQTCCVLIWRSPSQWQSTLSSDGRSGMCAIINNNNSSCHISLLRAIFVIFLMFKVLQYKREHSRFQPGWCSERLYCRWSPLRELSWVSARSDAEEEIPQSDRSLCRAHETWTWNTSTITTAQSQMKSVRPASHSYKNFSGYEKPSKSRILIRTFPIRWSNKDNKSVQKWSVKNLRNWYLFNWRWRQPQGSQGQ